MGAVPIVCAEEEVDAGNAHNGASRYPAAAVESYMIHIKLPTTSASRRQLASAKSRKINGILESLKPIAQSDHTDLDAAVRRMYPQIPKSNYTYTNTN